MNKIRLCPICGEEVIPGYPVGIHKPCLELKLLEKLTELVELMMTYIKSKEEK